MASEKAPPPTVVGPQVLAASSHRILRSPSHESVTTDLSLLSVSSLASEPHLSHHRRLQVSFTDHHLRRGPSPNPDDKHSRRPADIPEILWFEEETDLIRGCAALSSVLGLHKSFSTSDITQLPSSPEEHPIRTSVSDLALSSWAQRYGYVVGGGRLEAASRSCSTWVAVGDLASQLASPHAGAHTTSTSHTPPSFTPADLVRSVNKKVRQNYIRRRLLTTYKALERLSQSEFDLDRLGAAVAAAGPSNRLQVPEVVRKEKRVHLPLTVTDVERERGKPLSKYDRNMMIFNWLHTLDEPPPPNT